MEPVRIHNITRILLVIIYLFTGKDEYSPIKYL